MAGARRSMQAVELIDAGALPGPDAGVPPPPDADGRVAPGRRSRRSGRRRRGVVLLAAVVVLVLAGGVVGQRREAHRAAVLAAVPGVVASLERPVTELWRTGDRPLGELSRAGGRLVGAVEGATGAVDVVALEESTGRDVWRTTVGTGPADARWTTCATAGAAVACVVVDDTATTEPSALGSRTYPTGARLVVVDVATGEVLRDGPTPPTAVLAATGGDLVVAEVDRQGRARVARTDPRTGALRWSSTGPTALPADQFRQRTVRLEVAGDLVAVDGGPVRVLSARDGSLVDAWEPDASLGDGGQVQLLAGGAVLARPADADGAWGTEVVDVATGRRSTVRGYPVPVRPDDGSLAGAVLMLSVQGLDLLAVDAASGRVRWSARAGSAGAPLVVDGRVVRAEGTSLRARHGGTGEVLWSTPLDALTQGPVATDGRSVLVSVPRAGGGGELVAVALADGRRQWSVDTDQEVVLGDADGLLLGWSGTELVAFGAAPDTG